MTTRANINTLIQYKISLALIGALLIIILGVTQAWAQAKKDNPSSQRVQVGNVSKVTGTTVTISDKTTKASVDTLIDRSTRISSISKRVQRLADIKPNDMVVVIGTDSAAASGSANPGQQIKALRVYVKEASEPASLQRHAVYGVINDISGTTIKINHPIQKDRNFTITTDKATVFKIKGITDAKLSDLSVGLRIAAVGIPQPDGSLKAVWVHIIPGLGKGLPKVATPSATPTKSPTASPSATPTSTPSATPTP